MDLRSLMNNDSAEAARPPPSRESRESRDAQQQQQHQHRNSSIHPPPPRAASGSYASPPLQHNPHMPKPTPPLYQHHSIDSRASNGSIPPPRLTPLQTPTGTPGQAPGATGYPFPSGPYQSPSQPQHYRANDAYQHQVATPGGSRPPAPLYQYSQAASSPYGAPSQQQPPPPPALHHSASHPSMSPTPPGFRHQPPPHVREGSMSTTQHYPHPQPQYPMNNQHPSQPSTPLGPPSAAQFQRQFPPAQSPYGQPHHRTSSGASHGQVHGIVPNSPAQSVAAGHLSESPAIMGHPGPIGLPKRQTSGSYVSDAERERSLSVSPKTRIVPRHNSQGSYYSNQDAPSARNSVSASQPENDSLLHQTQPPHEPQHHFRSSGDMSHTVSPLTTTRQQPSFHATTAPSPSSRSSQTPIMRNILNDSAMAPSPVRASPAANHMQTYSPHANPSASAPVPPSNATNLHPKRDESSVKLEPSGFPQESLLQQPVKTPGAAFPPAPETPADHGQPPVQMKRPAESTPESTHPVKRAKKRYAEPPIWARFVRSNPRFGDNPQSLPPPPQQPQVKKPSPLPPSRPGVQPNGHQAPHVANGTPSAPPLGLPSNVIPRLGPWELNIKNVRPADDFLREIGEFLFAHATRNDIGTGDLRSGALEIEAKLGMLIDKQTGQRVATMGRTNTVLDHSITNSGRIRFESFMTELQHKQMNDYLNKTVQASMEPGRVKMGYKHRYERDSFATLNRAGYEALPPSARAHLRPGHSLKLRTTIPDPEKVPKDTPPVVLGRIVKVRLDDLDILCPKMDFDCRISVNVEVDLNNRPDVDPTLIVDEADPNDPDAPQARRKDRLSYQHLAYSVDLTQVILTNGKKSHELEIEIDSTKLREEAMRCMQGQDNAYETLVDGFLSNVLTLMGAQREGAVMVHQGGGPPHPGR